MYKVTLKVEGMACGMCESHVNDAVRKAFPVKKVASSHLNKRTEIIAERAPDEQRLRQVIAVAGYEVRDVAVEPYEKKGFSLFRR